MLKELRTAKGLTQQAVADRAKVSRNYITMLELGTRKQTSLPVLRRIAKALDCPVSRLLGEE